MTPEQLDQLDTLLDSDMSMEQIARELGMAYNTFRIRFAESGYRIKRVRCPITPTPSIRQKDTADKPADTVPSV